MRKLAFISLLFFLILSYLSIIFFKATDNPDFCNTCHFMKPYYDNWASSSHNTVPCYKCHYGPGKKEYIGGKLRLTGEILRYFAGFYSKEIKTKVKDDACLECHKKEEFLNKEIKFTEKEISFNHNFHLNDKTNNLNFRCQNCHSELVQGKHTAVSIKVCILCHFIGGEFGKKGECGICHGPPKEELLLWGVPFKHYEYIKGGVDCLTCHLNVISGRGDIKSEKCLECHIEVKREFLDKRKIHDIHVHGENISCFRCHEEIKHGKILVTQVFSPQCQECHGNAHFVQEKIYSGTGGIGVPNLPDRMFIAGVICQGCHKVNLERTLTGPHFKLPKANPSECVFCHGKNFDKLLLKWQNLVKERIERIKKREKIYSLLKDLKILQYDSKKIELNLELVNKDKSFGAHNIRYINLLLDEVEKELKIDTKKPDIEKIYSNNPKCIECHFGVENKNLYFKNKEFLHGPHLFNYKCNDCHIEDEPSKDLHGNLKKISEDCNSCHHQKEKNCEDCHKIQKEFYSGEYLSESMDVMKEAGIDCSDCHIEEGKIIRPEPSICSNCHETSYEKDFAEKLNFIKSEIKKFEFRIEEIVNKLKEKGNKKEIIDFYNFLEEYEKFKKEGSYGTHNIMFMEEFFRKIKKYNY